MVHHLLRTLLFASLVFALLLSPISARQNALQQSDVQQSNVQQNDVQPPRLKATNTVALRQLLGKEVTVYGRVESTGKSSSGHQFLNFYGKQVSVMCPSNLIAKFRDGAPADVYRGKTVEVTGQLQLYKGKLQLKLTDPEKIKKLETTGDSGAVRKKVELKSIGRNAWISPAGLRYQGRDPDGRTRVEHVLRHGQDLPQREGPHGVFDGDRGTIFAVIDEAWKLAQTLKLSSRVEGDRSTFLVRMNRRVGYLGGRTGKQRRHPPLARVFIVFETDTKNIITAFPK